MANAYGQGDYSAYVLTFKPGGREIAMGGAGTASSTDFWSSYYNPGGLGFVTNTSAGFYKTGENFFFLGDMDYYYGGFAVKIKSLGVIGFSLARWDMGSHEYRDEFNNLLGTTDRYQMAPAITFARQISGNASIGISAKYIRIKLLDDDIQVGSQVFDGTASTFALDLGFQYKNFMPQLTFGEGGSSNSFFSRFKPERYSRGLSFGITLRNVGGAIEFVKDTPEDPLPTEIALGVSYTAVEYKDIFALRSSFDIAKTLVHWTESGPDSWYKALFTSWKDKGFDEIMFGVEFDFINLVAVRMGKHIRNFQSFSWDDYDTYGVRIGPEGLSLNLWKRVLGSGFYKNLYSQSDNVVSMSASFNLSDLKR